MKLHCQKLHKGGNGRVKQNSERPGKFRARLKNTVRPGKSRAHLKIPFCRNVKFRFIKMLFGNEYGKVSVAKHAKANATNHSSNGAKSA